jgi:hypothetical protein|nr:MAG TPA: Head Tail Connector Protein [Caudoviricetes sp.]
MLYANYEYYTGVYGGEMSEAEFKALSRKASAYIDMVTFKRARNYQGGDEVKEACCAIADELKKQSSNVISESVGSWSRQYKIDEKGEKTLFDIASMYLALTGLLYAGR